MGIELDLESLTYKVEDLSKKLDESNLTIRFLMCQPRSLYAWDRKDHRSIRDLYLAVRNGKREKALDLAQWTINDCKQKLDAYELLTNQEPIRKTALVGWLDRANKEYATIEAADPYTTDLY